MKQLILIRHGKPEPTGAGKPDALRELTPAGRAALAAPTGFETTFTELLADAEGAGLDLAPEGQSIALWTSPAVRAHQTADEARGALERLGRSVSAPVEHTSLWEQDDAAFLAELAQAQATSIVASPARRPPSRQVQRPLSSFPTRWLRARRPSSPLSTDPPSSYAL